MNQPSNLRRRVKLPVAAAILLLPLAQAALAAGEASPLAERLMPLIEAHQGRVGAAVKNLKTGESFAHKDEEAMPTASLIKFPVLIELYRQAEAGQVDLDKMLSLRETDKVPGSGILTPHFSAGASFSLRDAARLMIAFSDNTATNLVLDEIGLPATTETMQQLGCPNTRLHAKVYLRDKTSIDRERSERFGLGSTTAAEMLRLYELLEGEELVSPKASKTIREHLKACQEPNKFPRFLPPGTVLAFKGGSVNDARTAAGIIESPAGPIAICVLTAENQDKSWTAENAGDRLCAEIAREAFGYFNPSVDAAKPAQSAGD
ncbi:MAG TPA: serine hydrolase [Pirellulales bacterium]|nr:serine hydrolase [Pirellulales bacterium]